MFKFFIEYDLISSEQSVFKPKEYCVFQLVFMTHEIYKSFDEGNKIMGAFIDISEAFDKVWHDGIIFKLTQNGIPGNLVKLLRDFLSERRQIVVVNCQISKWANNTAGVPQGYILIRYCFLIFINYLS